MCARRKASVINCSRLAIEVELTYAETSAPAQPRVPFHLRAQPSCTGQYQCPVAPQDAWGEWNWHLCPHLPRDL